MIVLFMFSCDERTVNRRTDVKSPLWAERKKPLTNRAHTSEADKNAATQQADTRLLELVQFLARSAAEADFNDEMLKEAEVHPDQQQRTRP